MPPLASWFGGIDEVEAFLRNGPLSGEWRWRHLPAHVNGQVAVGVYHLDPESGSYLPFALDVLTLEGSRIKQVTAFIVRTTDLAPEDFERWPAMASDAEMVRRVFESCGLPARLD
jgi:RNA polymerase sigma-70 factor (ECF subfamily)